jgi:hypothetical protein
MTSKIMKVHCVMAPGPRKYISKVIGKSENMFGCKPREYMSPLQNGDHPEVSTSDKLDAEGIKKYQRMIGSLQLAVSLGKFDIQTAIMTMSRFRAAPRQGHLDQLKWMYRYLRRYASAVVHARVEC